MARMESFDDFNSSEYAQASNEQKPFQFRDNKNNKEATLKWLNTNFDSAQKRAQSRIEAYIRWSFLYKGIHWRSHNATRQHEVHQVMTDTKPKMVNNFIREFIDIKVSQMSRLGTAFTAIPWNDEVDDINNARSCELLLKARNTELDMDDLQNQADRIKFKFGTVFQFVTWDKEAGPIHPAYEKLNKIYKGEIPPKVLKKLKNQESFKVGDVGVENECPYNVFPEMGKKKWKDVNHVDRICWKHVDEVKAEYPNMASKIADNQRQYFDFETNEMNIPDDMIMVRYFYHKKTKYLPEGALIVYCDDCILHEQGLPFNHGELPLSVDRDIIIEDELFGRPCITDIEQMQRQYNNIDSSVARDLGVGSAPKWVFPKGAVDYKQVNNEFTVMEYKGAKEPKLVANNPVSDQALAVQDRMETRMSKLMRVYDISRGNVPTGITANSALRFLDEQEQQASEEDQKKRKRRLINTYKLMMSTMGQYYDESDNRTVRLLGANNSYLIKSLKKADFMRVADIQMQNTSALPDTKAGKIAAIVDLNAATQMDPIFRKEQVVHLLDMGSDDAFVDQATASYNTAKATFEAMMGGEKVDEPSNGDDLMVFYTTFMRLIQDFGYRQRTKPELKAKIESYIKTCEGLLWEKSNFNPTLRAEILALNYFPAFYKPALPPTPALPAPPVEPVAAPGVNPNQMENTQRQIKGEMAEQQ